MFIAGQYLLDFPHTSSNSFDCLALSTRAVYCLGNDGRCRQSSRRCLDCPTQLPLQQFPRQCCLHVDKGPSMEAAGGRINRSKGNRRALHCRLVSYIFYLVRHQDLTLIQPLLRVSLLGVITAGCSYTLIRKIGHRASATHTVLYFAMTSTLASPILMLIQGEEWVLPTQPVWIMLLLLVGLFGLGAQVCILLPFGMT
jgi:hypothetical protein